jgi:hypothetical protein
MAWRRNRRWIQRVPADWIVAQGVDTVTGRPIVIRINRVYADVSNRQSFPIRVECTIALNEPRADGLPEEQELPSLADSDDRLVSTLAREAVLAAVVTGNARHQLVFYSRVRTAFNADGVTTTRIGEHDVRFNVESDREWSEFDRLLAAVKGAPRPSSTKVELAPDAQSDDVAAADRAILDRLSRRGVDLTAARTVHHYLFLPSDATRRDAAAHVAASGWDVEQRAPTAGDADRRLLVATRHDVVLDHEAVVVARAFFDATAARFGGEYDGWDISV